jgi:aquaporin Z
VGPISGAAFNPAVAVGVTLMGLGATGILWVVVVANLIGGAAAALLFNALDMGNDKATTATPADQARLQGAAEPGR